MALEIWALQHALKRMFFLGDSEILESINNASKVLKNMFSRDRSVKVLQQYVRVAAFNITF